MRRSCTPCPVKALACPSRASWEKAPARSPNSGKCGNEESYGKIQGGAEKGRHGICGMPGASQEDTMEGPLWRETLGRSLRSQNAAEFVGGICHGNVCQHETPASTPYLAQRRGGALSPTIGCSTRHWLDPFAKAKSSFLLKIHGPSERELAGKTAD